MATSSKLHQVLILACAACVIGLGNFVSGRDPDPVLDFCVAVLPHQTGVWESSGTESGNWEDGYDPMKMGVAETLNVTTDSDFPCKDVAKVNVSDFVFKGLSSAGQVTSKLGSVVTLASVEQFPALNTLELSAARVDFIKNGLNPPHVHPRATEMFFVVTGELLVGFVDTSNVLFETTLQAGDLFVFPEGLLHFQQETGKGEAEGLAFLNSQNPGTLKTVAALLGSYPKPLPAAVIESALNIDAKAFGSLVSGFVHQQSA